MSLRNERVRKELMREISEIIRKEVSRQSLNKTTKTENYKNFVKNNRDKCKLIITKGGHFAYLKIAEGCNKKCTYCAIPSFRGEYKSVPMEVLVKEAEELANKGVKELIIVAQETTVYGIDLYGEKRLHLLLNKPQ